MSTAMSSDERSKVVANNRSLRMIKNELETLCEREVITDEQFDLIMKTLPPEQSLHGSSSPSLPRQSSAVPSSPAPNLNGQSAPAAAPTNANAIQTPAPPPRNTDPQHVEIAHVVAQYKYHDPDPRDLDFEAGDHISVTEYCNTEWWQGRNIRTGRVGIFPRNYVRVEDTPSSLASKNAPYSGPPQPVAAPYYAPPPYQQQQPPAPGRPYDAPVPPMAVAEQPPEGHRPGGKGMEMGKKFGRKLGNAAIFGAGATLGSDIVNSII